MPCRNTRFEQESGRGSGGFGRGRRGRGHHGPGYGNSRMTDGDLRLVMMALLAEQPRQGQEIMTALGERVGSRCSASPALVYPNLMLLEDMGLASVVAAADGRRLFALTEQGTALLGASRAVIEALLAEGAAAEGVGGQASRGLGKPYGGRRRCRRGGLPAASEGAIAGG